MVVPYTTRLQFLVVHQSFWMSVLGTRLNNSGWCWVFRAGAWEFMVVHRTTVSAFLVVWTTKFWTLVTDNFTLYLSWWNGTIHGSRKIQYPLEPSWFLVWWLVLFWLVNHPGRWYPWSIRMPHGGRVSSHYTGLVLRFHRIGTRLWFHYPWKRNHGMCTLQIYCLVWLLYKLYLVSLTASSHSKITTKKKKGISIKGNITLYVNVV